MDSRELRKKFFQYFSEREHAILPSSPVVPHDDPSLLFVNAGMNQFKPIFLGQSPTQYPSVVTAQKCIRVGGKHNDLDNVGFTDRHLTFFEMLGNFSFGKYFKREAIDLAWVFVTEILELRSEQLWITVFEKDEETVDLWSQHVDKSRIVRMGVESNFWTMGDTGPCGPCTELYYDRGDRFGTAQTPLDDPEGLRFVEFWNLVFMEKNRDRDGKLRDLPQKNIDTGMGMERMLALQQGLPDVFQTDVLRALIAEVENVAHKKYSQEQAPAFHIIADHVRSLAFSIADGAQPSNVDRGYVVRKILRRAMRYGRTLGLMQPFLGKIFRRLVSVMGEDFSELIIAQGKIEEVLYQEEENFQKTLMRGGNILQTIIDDAKETQGHQISGKEAFRLKDTYGFPLDELMLIAKDNGLTVNLDAFQLLEEEAKERSRASQKTTSQEISVGEFENFVKKHGKTRFLGYDTLHAKGSIVGIFANERFVDTLEEGQKGWVILDRTPFYGEMGGQSGDRGILRHHKASFTVDRCTIPFSGIIAHQGIVKQGTLIVGEPLDVEVNARQREDISTYHTATHLLHWALARVLGGHVRQAGSLVECNRLRFDFHHHKGMHRDEIREVERLVNTKIRENAAVKITEISYKQAQKDSSIQQFFGEKYGDTVRVVDIGGFAKELCGGTHVENLLSIGMFRIMRETSVAAGIRRIEALVGKEAEAWMFDREDLLWNIVDLLKVEPAQCKEKIVTLLDQQRKQKETLKRLKTEQLDHLVTTILARQENIRLSALFAYVSQEIDIGDLVQLGQRVLHRISQGIILLGAQTSQKIQIHLRLTSDLCDQGVHAGNLMKEIAPSVGGSGGGNSDSAMAGGNNPQGFDHAVQTLRKLLEDARPQT